MIALRYVLIVGLLMGCGGAVVSSPSKSPTIGNQDVEQAKALRSQQTSVLWSFQKSLQTKDCEAMCEQHTQVCTLATRICSISDANPGHRAVRLKCDKANDTCSETNDRLPKDCWCR